MEVCSSVSFFSIADLLQECIVRRQRRPRLKTPLGIYLVEAPQAAGTVLEIGQFAPLILDERVVPFRMLVVFGVNLQAPLRLAPEHGELVVMHRGDVTLQIAGVCKNLVAARQMSIALVVGRGFYPATCKMSLWGCLRHRPRPPG